MKYTLFCFFSLSAVAIHSQERPTATVTPIQAQSSTCLIPAAVIIPHHSVASQQLQPQLSNAATYITAVNINRTTVPLACAAAALNPPAASTSLDGEASGRIVTVHPGAPASPENTLAAGGVTTVSKPDRDSKVGVLFSSLSVILFLVNGFFMDLRYKK